MTLRPWDADRRHPGAHPLLLLALVLVLFAGCSSSGGRSGAGSGNTITQTNIESLGMSSENAYAVIDRIRPTWLRQRGPTSIQDPNSGFPVVYLDGTRFGEVDQLRGIRADLVASIQFLNASDATTRYGLGHVGGAILVVTKR